MTSIVLFAIFIVIYTIMIEVFTVLFRLTGVTLDKARTQVISLLTNSGYTTGESELILSVKRRRNLAQITMLCGYCFSIIIASMLVNIFLSMSQREVKSLLPTVVFTFFAMIALLGFMRLPPVRSRFDVMIERIGNRIMFGKHSNVLILIDIYKTNALAETTLDNLPHFLEGVKLGQSKLKETYGIQILSIRQHGEEMKLVDGETILRKGDTLLLFGDYKTIREVFEHPEV